MAIVIYLKNTAYYMLLYIPVMIRIVSNNTGKGWSQALPAARPCILGWLLLHMIASAGIIISIQKKQDV